MSLLLLLVGIVVFLMGSSDLAYRRHHTVYIKLNKCIYKDLSSSDDSEEQTTTSNNNAVMMGYTVSLDDDNYLILQECTVSGSSCTGCVELSRVKYVKNEFIKNILMPITNVGNSLRIKEIGNMPKLVGSQYAIVHYDTKSSCTNQQSDGINYVEYSDGDDPDEKNPYLFNCVDYGRYSKKCSCSDEDKQVKCETYVQGSSCPGDPTTPIVTCEDYAEVGVCSNDVLNPFSTPYDGIIADFSEDEWYPDTTFPQGAQCTEIASSNSLFIFKSCNNADCSTDCSFTIKNEYKIGENKPQQIYFSDDSGGYFYGIQNDAFKVEAGEQTSYSGNGGIDEMFYTEIVGGFPQESYLYTYNRPSYDDCFPLLGGQGTYNRRKCFSDGVVQLTEFNDPQCTEVYDVRNLTQVVCGKVDIPKSDDDLNPKKNYTALIVGMVFLLIFLVFGCCCCCVCCCLCIVLNSLLLLLGGGGSSIAGISILKRRKEKTTYGQL